MSAQLHLVAHLAGRGIAVPGSAVDAVVDIDTIVPAPGAAPAVRGLAALRSRVVTVVDTHRALGLDAPVRAPRRALVIRVDGHAYAILVDGVEDAVALAPAPLAPGLALGDAWGAIATGLIERDDEPLLAVDLAALVRERLVASAGLNVAVTAAAP